jgi:ElaB/YqjD/DUF883 family membrane-anchored ribosome-binding protein
MDDQNKSMNERWAPPPQKTERGYAGESGYRPGEQGAPLSDEALGESAARTREIRSEIDQTRDDISETIDAIQDRLAPRNVASRAAGSVREATMGKVRQMAHQVQDRMPSFGNDYSGNGIMDRIRENPVPTAIAAASLAWIAFGSRRRSHSQEFGQAIYGSTRGGEPYVRETRIDLGEGESHAWSGADTQWSGRERESMHRSAEQMRAARRRARQVADENPFAAGAIAAAVGLAIGLAIPETEREDELMGEAKESLMERGRETVRERVQNAASQVQRVAGDALTGGTKSEEKS